MSDDRDLSISADVLYGIVQLAVEGVDGLTLAAPSPRVGEILSGRRAKGIRIERTGERVRISLSASVTYGMAIPQVAVEAQRAVREAVASMTGLEVDSVDVHVDRVTLPAELASG